LEDVMHSVEDREKMEQEKDKFDRNFALAISTLIILISVFLIVVDLKTLHLTNDMRILGEGAFPLLLFATMIVLTLWYMTELITGKGSSAKLEKHIEVAKIKKALRLYFLIVGSILLMNFVGFVIAMMFFTFCEMKFLSEKKLSLPTIIVCSVLIPLSIYFIFGALNVFLPSPTWMPF